MVTTRLRRPAPPRGLSKESRKLWTATLATFEIQDEHDLVLLEAACRATDTRRAAEAILAEEGCVVVDRFGQKRGHPAAVVARDAATTYVKCISALGVNEPVKKGV